MSVITLFAIHWLKTLEAYSAMPLKKNTNNKNKGIFSGFILDVFEKFSSINGFNKAGTSGSSVATETIARTEPIKTALYLSA